jgi:hypothetical protein
MADRSAALLAARWTALRRSTQDLEVCPATRELHNDIYRLERLEKVLAKRKWTGAEEVERLARLPEMRRIAAAIQTLATTAARSEDETLLALYRRGPVDVERIEAAHTLAREEWRRLVLALFALGFKRPDRATVGVFGGDAASVAALVRVYLEIAERTLSRSAMVRFVTAPHASRHDRAYETRPVRDPLALLSEIDDATVGFAVEIAGPFAFPRFEGERGRHDFTVDRKTHHCVVAVSEDSLVDYKPPPGVERRQGLSTMPPRRTYDLARNALDDTVLGKSFTWTGRSMTTTLHDILETRLWREAAALCGRDS